MPPVATTGTSTASATAGTSANVPDQATLGQRRIERAAVAAGFRALRDDDVGARVARRDRFGHRRGHREPGDAARLQLGDERRREQPHDRRHGRGLRVQHRLALGAEVGRRRVAGVCRDGRSPAAQKIAHAPLIVRGRAAAAGREPTGSTAPGPRLPARNSRIQAAIASGPNIRTPAAPMPPALATAIDSDGGQAPAMGASRIGRRRPKRSQKAAARASGRRSSGTGIYGPPSRNRSAMIFWRKPKIVSSGVRRKAAAPGGPAARTEARTRRGRACASCRWAGPRSCGCGATARTDLSSAGRRIDEADPIPR